MTFRFTEVPNRRYTSMLAYRDVEFSRFIGKPDGVWPCRHCGGTGFVWLDDGDPIEGHKMSDSGPCPVCHRTRVVSEAQFRVWYEEARDAEMERIGRLSARLSLEKTAMTKVHAALTRDEMRAIGLED